jgi:hypothetical protein
MVLRLEDKGQSRCTKRRAIMIPQIKQLNKHSRAMSRTLSAILPGFVLLFLLSYCPSRRRVRVSSCFVLPVARRLSESQERERSRIIESAHTETYGCEMSRRGSAEVKLSR